LLQDVVIASPDVGGVVRANGLAYRLDNRPLVICDKRRTAANVAEIVHVIGDVVDKDVLIVDDIIDTGGSLIKAAQVFKDRGAVAFGLSLLMACLVKEQLMPLKNQ